MSASVLKTARMVVAIENGKDGCRALCARAVNAQVRNEDKVHIYWADGANAGPLGGIGSDVKYRGKVDLAPFTCVAIIRSSFIQRVCYDRANAYMLISLNGIYCHYCEIDGGTVSALMTAESTGRYYNASIKGRFDCRTHRIPEY